jgi:hypothetical protein
VVGLGVVWLAGLRLRINCPRVLNATLLKILKAHAPPLAIFLTHSPVQPGITIVLKPGEVPTAAQIQADVLAGIKSHRIPVPLPLQVLHIP